MLIIAPDEETAKQRGGTDAKFHSQFLREETEFLIPAKRGLGTVLKGDLPGHPFRGNQYTEGSGAEIDEDATRSKKPPPGQTFYRATEESLANSIFKKGIERGDSWDGKPPSVYVTKTYDSAVNYALQFMYKWGIPSAGYSIVELRIPKGVKLIPDRGDVGMGSYRMERDVPAEWVKKISVYDKIGNLRKVHERKQVDDEVDIYCPIFFTAEAETETKGGPGSGEQEGHPFRGNQWTEGNWGKMTPLDTDYGGIPSGGGYGQHTEYEIGIHRFADAVHCVLGSLCRSYTSSVPWKEHGHIHEELQICGRLMDDYGRQLYNNQLVRMSEDPKRADAVEKTLADLQKNSDRLINIATKAKDALEKNHPDVNDPRMPLARKCYSTLIKLATLAKDMNKGNMHYENVFRSASLLSDVLIMQSMAKQFEKAVPNPWTFKGESAGHPFRGNQYREGEHGGGTSSLNERARRAKETHVPVTKRMRVGARTVQQQIADAIPGAVNIPDNEPFDVHIGNDHLIEVKSVWKAKNDKITVHPPSLQNKKDMIEKHKGAKPSTIIVDERVKPAKVYHREGVGSFRFGGMTLLGEKHGETISKDVLKKLRTIYGGK